MLRWFSLARLPVISCVSCPSQVLVALACDLGLDALPCCAGDPKWSWFRRYCQAARVAMTMQQRTRLPLSFIVDVRRKVEEANGGGAGGGGSGGAYMGVAGMVDRRHEDQCLFTRQLDEQLLLWMNRLAETSTHTFLTIFSKSYGSFTFF